MRFSLASIVTAALALSVSAAPAGPRINEADAALAGDRHSRFPWGSWGSFPTMMFPPGGARPTGFPGSGNRPPRPTGGFPGVFPPGGAMPTGFPARPTGFPGGPMPTGGFPGPGGPPPRPTGGFPGFSSLPPRSSGTGIPSLPTGTAAPPAVPSPSGDIETISFELPTPTNAADFGFDA